MLLTPHEQERLMVAGAADVARRRRERGLLLNHPEAVALLTDWVLEAARSGDSVASIMSAGRDVLDTSDVMEGVEVLIDELQVEATFPDGTKLVTLHGPVQPALLDPAARPGDASSAGRIVPGELLLADDDVTLLDGRDTFTLVVTNTGDRPVQVGSHFHLAESNDALEFDRDAAIGHRLAIPAGTSVRFEPGIQMEVELVAFAGAALTAGFRGRHSTVVSPTPSTTTTATSTTATSTTATSATATRPDGGDR